MQMYVTLSCNKEEASVEEIEVENIEEDIYGADVVTYLCPLCEEYHKSNVYRK